MTHVLTTHVSEHTLILTVVIGKVTLQNQQLVVAMEMGSVSGASRPHDITMSSVHQQIRDVTFQILRNHGNCVVSKITGCGPDFDLNNIKNVSDNLLI